MSLVDRRRDRQQLVDADAAGVAGLTARGAAGALADRAARPRRDGAGAGSSSTASYGALHAGQTRRTRRCATTRFSDDATAYGSMPRSMSRVTVAAASLVCRVLSTRCPVCAAWKAISRRLLVADLADQDDVGVLPQHRAQHAREGEALLLVDLDLVDALQLVLDRVLDGDDVDLRREASRASSA